MSRGRPARPRLFGDPVDAGSEGGDIQFPLPVSARCHVLRGHGWLAGVERTHPFDGEFPPGHGRLTRVLHAVLVAVLELQPRQFGAVGLWVARERKEVAAHSRNEGVIRPEDRQLDVPREVVV